MRSLRLYRMSIEQKITGTFRTAENAMKLFENDPVVMALSTTMSNRAEQAEDSLGPKNEKLFTEELVRIDTERDDAYRSLYYIIWGYENYCPKPELRDQIKVIFNNLDKDKLSIINGSMYAQSADVSNKIKFLKQPENLEVLEQLNLLSVLDNVEQTNIQFEQVYDNRLDKKLNRPKTIQDVAQPLDQSIRALYTYIQSEYGNESTITCFTPLIEMG
jgi:Family of unknown function (DUF6261)